MSESAVNYIAHQSGVLETLFSDERISPWHISLYMALFITWNQTRFKSEISITREEIMDKSKIGSANTYTKCIKQLDEWGYIKYLPSTNKYKASKVHMYRFDKGSDNGADNGTDKSSDNGTDNGSDKAPVTHLRPFLNNTKHKENNNKQYKTSKGESNSPPPPPSSKNKSIKKKKKFIPPKLEETKAFFQEQKSTNQNAEMFQNHFESNGWLVGGKTKMKDWKAAARNWILRSSNFNNSKKSNLHINQDKDYDIPL